MYGISMRGLNHVGHINERRRLNQVEPVIEGIKPSRAYQ